MKRLALVFAPVLFTLAAVPVVPAGPADFPSDGGASLVRLPDGTAFRVELPDVGTVRVRVFDEATGAPLFDSGWRSGDEVAWHPGEEVGGPWRYRIEARDAEGALVLSQTAIRRDRPRAVAPKTSHGPSVMNLGSSSSSGELRVFLEGSSTAVTQLDSSSGGGVLRLLDEEGFTTARIEPDSHGTGAFLNLFRGQGESGMFFDGNKGGSGEPLLSITGSVQSATFDMSMLDDDSVILPAGAISAGEMFDEPGGASVHGTGDPNTDTLLTRTITVPSAGLVLAIGTAEVQVTHNEGTATLFTLGISRTTTLPTEQEFTTRMSANLPTGNYSEVVTVHGLFSVSQGPNAFRLLKDTLASGLNFAERQLSLVYLPTAYGTVSPITSPAAAVAAGEHGAGEGAVAADLAAAEAVTAERLRLEVETMARRLRELEALLAEQDEGRR